jgi:glycosyltransferase involved in cell wall biosynthesis
MKLLFLTAHYYLPQMYGGLQRSTDQFCKTLREQGHEVAVLSKLKPEGELAEAAQLKMKANGIFACEVARDEVAGYPVWRAWAPWEATAYVVAQEKPDLCVVLAMQPVRMAQSLQSTSVPMLIQLQDVEFGQHGGDFGALGPVNCVANSHFTAGKYREEYGVDPAVIHPFMMLDRYWTPTTQENVTFINPHPKKGVNIALGVARECPDIPFVFVEGWPLSPKERERLVHELASLPNVQLRESCDDMRDVYCKAKILLVPSTWEEGYGRVVSEAQISGIPVVASTRGGLPEAVGPGGVLLDPEDPIEQWGAAVRRLWNDDVHYCVHSVAAEAHAKRPELGKEYYIRNWEEVLRKASAS